MSETTTHEAPPAEAPPPAPDPGEAVAASWYEPTIDAPWGTDRPEPTAPLPPSDDPWEDPLARGWIDREQPSEPESTEEYDHLRSVNDLNAQLLAERREAREAEVRQYLAHLEGQILQNAIEQYEDGADPAALVESVAGVSPDVAARLLRYWQEDEAPEPEDPTAAEYTANLMARAEQARLLQEAEARAKSLADENEQKIEVARREFERMHREDPNFHRYDANVSHLSAEAIVAAPVEQTAAILRDAHSLARQSEVARWKAAVQADMDEAVWLEQQWLGGRLAEPALPEFNARDVFAERYEQNLPELPHELPRVLTHADRVAEMRASLEPDDREKALAAGFAAIQNADLHTRRKEDANLQRGNSLRRRR